MESKDDEPEEGGVFGTAKPMLPYSSMFILGSTNPYALLTFKILLFVLLLCCTIIEYVEILCLESESHLTCVRKASSDPFDSLLSSVMTIF